MRKYVMSSLMVAALSFAVCGSALAQTTTTVTQTPTTVTKTVQHQDGTYTIIEYPVGKETIVTLDPIALQGAGGTATILRDDTGTRIKINMTGLPKEVTAVNLYAVDPSGAVTTLGPVVLADGVGTFAGTTPLSKFMIVAAPESTLATYDPNTKVLFRSAVPAGFAVIPHTVAPVGEKVVATTATTPATTVTKVTPATTETPATTVTKITPATTETPATTVTKVTPATTETPATTVTKVTPATTETPATTTTTTAYTVPMLNIPAYKKGDDTKMKVNFSGALEGARANVFITPRKDGPTEVKLRFHDLKEAPAGKVFTAWAIAPDNSFVKIGQIVNVAGRNEAEIKSEIALPDFGLFITMEDATGTLVNPLGPSIGIVQIAN